MMRFFRRRRKLDRVRVINLGPDDILVVRAENRITNSQAEHIQDTFAQLFDIASERIVVLPVGLDVDVIKGVSPQERTTTHP